MKTYPDNEISKKSRKSSRRQTVTEIIFENINELSSPKKSVSIDINEGRLVKKTCNTVYKNFKKDIIDEYVHGDLKDTFDTTLISNFIQKQQANDVININNDILKTSIIYNMVLDMKHIDKHRFLFILLNSVADCIDIFLDIAVLLQYIHLKYTTFVILQGLTIGISFFLQFAVSIICNQPIGWALTGLIGIKPILDNWRDATTTVTFSGQITTNAQSRWISRIITLVFRAIPQLFIQMNVMLRTNQIDISVIQYLSVATSILSIGLSVSSADRAMDMNKTLRLNDPHIHGYVNLNIKPYCQYISSIAFFSANITMKTYAVSILLISGFGIERMFIWFLLEFCLLLSIKVYLKNWRFYRRYIDSFFISLLFNLSCYLALMTVPFPLLRLPGFVTCKLYVAYVIYMILINYVMIFIAYRYYNGHDNISEKYSFLFLLFNTFICNISFAISYYHAPKSFKAYIFKYNTMKDYIYKYVWIEAHERIYNSHILDSQEEIRATLACRTSINYLPIFSIIKFYSNNWEKWTLNNPEWFTEDFINDVPRELLVGVRSVDSENVINDDVSF